jgi:CubicO group peptidase (beta-lactamase class C family)
MKFSSLGTRVFLIALLLVITGYACKNLFSKNIMPDVHCLECLEKYSLSTQQEKAIARAIHADVKERRLDSLFRFRAKRLGFNGNVEVIQDGIVLYKNSFGYEDYKQKKLLTEQSKFQLASLSKTFTAVAILKLMEEGSLTLQDTIQQYFPDFPVHGVTMEMLLCHRSGLPDYRFEYPAIETLAFKGMNNQDLMKQFAQKPPHMMFRPGKKFCYCNSNFAILGAVVEKISEMPFDEYMSKYVFKPLGMNNTYVITSTSDSLNVNKTQGYDAYGHCQCLQAFDGIVGDKGVYSTTDDLAKWYHTLNSECFLKKATLDMAFQPRSFEHPGLKNYGLGFRMIHYNDSTKCIYHNGWWRGYNSLFYMCPRSNSVVIVLGNRFNHSVYMVKEVMDILQKDMASADIEEEPGE